MLRTAPARRKSAHLAITGLARRFGLSRSTLLYYDRIGLLKAGGRTASGYRFYGPEEEKRLARICELRRAGLALREIQVVLGDRPGVRSDVISRRIEEISRQMTSLREQQRLLSALHHKLSRKRLPKIIDKAAWVEMLAKAGMDDAAMMRWHAEFELSAPEEHGRFLASLGIPQNEIARIRENSRRAGG